MNLSGVVFNIQRFSLHDGPGIRTTVFLKGCSMRCFWCHNPEGRRRAPELSYQAERCLHCGQCVSACPNHAHELREGRHVFHRELCLVSGECVTECPSQALQLEGRSMTVGEVMTEILRDRTFYASSGGGVTLSGGEPALAKEFARELLEQCRAHGLHTAIETCGECEWTALDLLLPFTDLVMMDLKHLDPAQHREATGHSNRRILDNARRLAATDKPIVFRTPVIPGVNDSAEDIGQIADFVHDLIERRKQAAGPTDGSAASISYALLAFHRLAAGKYASLGLDYRAASLDPPTREKIAELVAVAREHGIDVHPR